MNIKIKYALDRAVLLAAVVCLVLLVRQYGYEASIPYCSVVFTVFTGLVAIQMGTSLKTSPKPLLFKRATRTILLGISLIAAGFGSLISLSILSGSNQWAMELGTLLLALTILIERFLRIKVRSLHPALIFVSSFAALIAIGTLLLLLPQSTGTGISLIDALFTATSAVCVTGLTVLTTSEDFTRTGQVIILVLFQLGGLGMLTFTNIFGLFFRSFGSFRNRLLLKDIINSRTVEGTRGLLIRILAFTFVAEAVGALIIYMALNKEATPGSEQVWFSIFHAVSAFCNAGFSTLPDSLYQEGYRYQYGIHLTIAVLIILGGIGFNTIIGYINFTGQVIRYYFYRLIRSADHAIPASLPVLSANNKLVLRVTFGLLLTGTVLFYFFTRGYDFEGHTTWGQWVTAFFASVTARTAGFNTFDTSAVGGPALLLLLLLMWIGASPGSTGGGIKTTTFGIALLNIWQQMLGSDRIVLGWKRVPDSALHRALAIIMLSLPGIGIPVFLLYHFEQPASMIPIVFECVSAYCTVGLSMGITENLSAYSKFTLVVTMFVGRVSLLTLLSGIARQLRKEQHDPARYPQENIFIN